MYIIDISYFKVYSVKMVDTSDYMVKYRVHAALFCIATDQSRHAMKLVRDRLRAKYDIEPPDYRVIKACSDKLLETGSLFDKQGVNDQLNGEMRSMMWRKVQR